MVKNMVVGGDDGDIVEILAEPMNKVVVGNVAKVIGKGDSRKIVEVLEEVMVVDLVEVMAEVMVVDLVEVLKEVITTR